MKISWVDMVSDFVDVLFIILNWLVFINSFTLRSKIGYYSNM